MNRRAIWGTGTFDVARRFRLLAAGPMSRAGSWVWVIAFLAALAGLCAVGFSVLESPSGSPRAAAPTPAASTVVVTTTAPPPFSSDPVTPAPSSPSPSNGVLATSAHRSPSPGLPPFTSDQAHLLTSSPAATPTRPTAVRTTTVVVPPPVVVTRSSSHTVTHSSLTVGLSYATTSNSIAVTVNVDGRCPGVTVTARLGGSASSTETLASQVTVNGMHSYEYTFGRLAAGSYTIDATARSSTLAEDSGTLTVRL